MFSKLQNREPTVAVLARSVLIGLLCFSLQVGLLAAPHRAQPQGNQKPQTSEPAQKPPPTTPDDAVETLKIETDLVTVPVIATDRNGAYIPDLLKNDFSLSEDGVQQQIAFFATISVPFNVVLMLDTSASTQDKIGLMQQAAVAFVEQLQSMDRVKVISFDDEVHDLNGFTNDRSALKTAIYRTRSGQGTKLYDAFALALTSLGRLNGRKAIVLFTDGVDYHSDYATFEGTLRGLDEEGVLVYPIRYDTRKETERLAREQADLGPVLPTLGVIRAPQPGTTAPTFPSDDPGSTPTSGTRNKTGPLGLPLPDEILRRRQEADRERARREQGRLPSEGLPPASDNRQGRTDTSGSWPGRDEPDASRGSTSRGSTSGNGTDSTSMLLDHLYFTADSYLKSLSDKSGGRLLRADNLGSLPAAFANIAGELRTQYSIGYYPTNKARDETYRIIKINTTRKNVAIRARPGYRAPSGG